MDDTFVYLDRLSQLAVSIERNFANALIGSKDGAIYQARNASLSYGQMIGQAGQGYQEALVVRNGTLLDICNNIAGQSLELAKQITQVEGSSEVNDLLSRHIAFTQERLERDGERKVAQYQLDIKRIAIIARSMRDDNDWDASAALLRSRESVDIRSQQSLDVLGRKQLTERFTKLMVRGLGISCLVDSIVAMAPDTSFMVVGFDGLEQKIIDRNDYQEQRESLFHPQCGRYLRPLGK